MIIKEMTDEQLKFALNYYISLTKDSDGNNNVNLKKLDEVYVEIIDRKLQRKPTWI
jgi:hypothetical protein